MSDQSIQDACCPDPSNSIIPEDQDTRPARRKLLWLYYGMIPYTILKALVFGSPIVLLLQLINLWIIYLGFATMHFCQTLICCIFFFLEFAQILALTF